LYACELHLKRNNYLIAVKERQRESMFGTLLVILLGLVRGERYIVSHDTAGTSYNKHWFYFSYINSIHKHIVIGDQTILSLEYDSKHIEDPHFLVSYPFINTIEVDHEVKMYDTVVPQQFNMEELEQLNPPLNLDRVDQRYMPLDGKYIYNDFAGINATVFIVDTGVDIKHPEFEGRAEWGVNTADSEGPDGCMEAHGTHVAGIVGSKTYGVAKKTKLVSVKVLDCTGRGSYSTILQGLEWISKQKVNYGIVNMSLGGPFSKIVNKAVDSLYSQAVSYTHLTLPTM
jgi:subtilisin family serine protease